MSTTVDLKHLGDRVRRTRQKRNQTLRAVHDATGVSIATLSRIERHACKEIDSGTLFKLSEWLGLSADELGSAPKVHRPEEEARETPDIVELHLRADKNLKPQTASALAKMFRVAYDELRQEMDEG